MAINAYLTPGGGTGTRVDPWTPKYRSPGASYWRFGAADLWLIVAKDIAPALDTTISADATCVALPSLDNTVGAGALTTVRNKLEALNIPGSWVTAGTTYRQVLKALVLVFSLMERHGGVLFTGGITLDTTRSQLSAGVKSKLQEVAAAEKLDTSAMTGSATVRQMLKGLWDQMPTPTPGSLYGEVV